MADPIDFYFDFSSPYGYLAAKQIDDIAARHGRAVRWRPHLIGAVFPTTANRSFSKNSSKIDATPHLPPDRGEP